MGKLYAFNNFQPGKAYAKCRLLDAKVSFKNTTQTANVLRGMTVERATAYLNNVIARKECVPFFKHKHGIGRCAQAKQFNTNQGRWPKKSAKILLDLLKNATSNAEYSGMDCEQLIIIGLQVSQASKRHRRMYRAHGRITPYITKPCHLEMILGLRERGSKKLRRNRRGKSGRLIPRF